MHRCATAHAGALWGLALGTGTEAAEALTNRLSAAIARDVPQFPGAVRCGWSSFAVDARDVTHLLAAARGRAGYADPESEALQAAQAHRPAVTFAVDHRDLRRAAELANTRHIRDQDARDRVIHLSVP